MNEIKCPNCGEGFTVNESQYSELLSQVRTAEFEIYNDSTGKLAMVKRILIMRVFPIFLLFSALLLVFSKLLTGKGYFSWEVCLIVIIDCVLLIVFVIQISYVFWRLFQKWKELSDK